MTFGASFNESGYSIRQITDGGYLFLAKDEEFDGVDFYHEIMLVKTDSLGQEEWRKVYDDSLISQYSSGLYILHMSALDSENRKLFDSNQKIMLVK